MSPDTLVLDPRDLLRDFNATLGVKFNAPADLIRAARAALEACKGWQLYGEGERQRRLLALANAKLKLNKDRLQAFLDAGALKRVFPNYHDKVEILECLDYADRKRFQRWLSNARYDPGLMTSFNPVTPEESLGRLHDLLRTGKVNRSDARECSLSERQREILRSLFGSYVFHTYPAEAMHRHFNADCRKSYYEDFYHHLLAFHPGSLRRDCALIYLRITQEMVQAFSTNELRDDLCGFIRDAYDRLSNHCVLAIQIPPFRDGVEDVQWRLFSELVLYAEKHREVRLKAGYFRPGKIEKATIGYIPDVDPSKARFGIANEGFFFRDCIILARPYSDNRPGDLLLLFDKNERDETLIPCPGCRSREVAGNSYPVLGVRSWECCNPICPDRSAFDRGNRYSLSAIIKQEAIKSEADQIPEWSLKRWKLDLVRDVSLLAVADMLIRHYSLHGDTVVFINGPLTAEPIGRTIVHEGFAPGKNSRGLFERFQASPFFNRFVLEQPEPARAIQVPIPHRTAGATVYNGHCVDVLFSLKESFIDGAVTSPPYYNARSYSQWPNIYCYLFDMYHSARAVYHALKPGAYYIFNIFDYFDNENSIVLSAMGKKRMILGAYIINLFRRIGFQLHGNTAWFKGEIEGKRNYNQGNRSPYYQAPLNCWEHCFIFRKPGGQDKELHCPAVLDAKPIYKMVRGENVLGHTAPFPPDIPLLLISHMTKGDCVLDPYSGSMTTARLAHQHGLKSVSIELRKEYCDLGIKLLENAHSPRRVKLRIRDKVKPDQDYSLFPTDLE